MLFDKGEFKAVTVGYENADVLKKWIDENLKAQPAPKAPDPES